MICQQTQLVSVSHFLLDLLKSACYVNFSLRFTPTFLFVTSCVYKSGRFPRVLHPEGGSLLFLITASDQRRTLYISTYTNQPTASSLKIIFKPNCNKSNLYSLLHSHWFLNLQWEEKRRWRKRKSRLRWGFKWSERHKHQRWRLWVSYAVAHWHLVAEPLYVRQDTKEAVVNNNSCGFSADGEWTDS